MKRSFGFIAIVFAVVYTIAYVIAVWNNYALFTFHPATMTLGWGVEKPQGSPAMYWYGWITTAALIAGAACLIAYLVPERVAQRAWSDWSWAAPVGVLFLFAYHLSGYFLR